VSLFCVGLVFTGGRITATRLRFLGKNHRESARARFVNRSEVVYERRKCKRCSIKLRRKLVTNSDGTLSSVGWEPDNEEGDSARELRVLSMSKDKIGDLVYILPAFVIGLGVTGVLYSLKYYAWALVGAMFLIALVILAFYDIFREG